MASYTFADVLRPSSGFLSVAFLSRLAITLLMLEVGWIFYYRFLHQFSDIPGPLFASISRLWLATSVAGGRIEHIQRALHKRYGPLVRIAPNEISVADPEAVKTIYKIKSGFTKTDFYKPFATGISPHGELFTEPVEAEHAGYRRIVNSVYSMSTILESEAYIDVCNDLFLEKMAKFAREKRDIDLGEWIQWYTFDVIGELFFGRQFGFMADEHDYGRYIQSVDTALTGLAFSGVLPSYLRQIYAASGLLLPSIRHSIKGLIDLIAVAKQESEARREQMKAGSIERVDLLDKFFRIDADEKLWDIRDIQGNALNGIFAGSDTTAIAIRSVLYHLMKKPKCMSMLIAEIDSFDSSSQLSNPHTTYSEAIKMPYLVACCKEGMRLHPSIGMGIPRHTPPGGAVIAGRFFPAGARVSMNAAVVHYDTSVFGEDAATFNPERWMDASAAARMDKYMLHFGGGSRTCIGKNISLAEIHKLIPTLLRRFEIELVDPSKEWTTHNFWTNKQTGIYARVTAR